MLSVIFNGVKINSMTNGKLVIGRCESLQQEDVKEWEKVSKCDSQNKDKNNFFNEEEY